MRRMICRMTRKHKVFRVAHDASSEVVECVRCGFMAELRRTPLPPMDLGGGFSVSVTNIRVEPVKGLEDTELWERL